MSKKFMVSLGAGILNNIFAWVAPLAFVYISYGAFFETKVGVYIAPFLFALVVLFRFVNHRLKTMATDGVGMSRELAREIKFIIPLVLGLALLEIVHYNVAGIVGVLTFTVVSNLIAVPFRIVSYRFSKRYERDLASLNSIAILQQINNKL